MRKPTVNRHAYAKRKRVARVIYGEHKGESFPVIEAHLLEKNYITLYYVHMKDGSVGCFRPEHVIIEKE